MSLLLLNVPEGTVIGVDLNEFRTGNKFLGIKEIPYGLHFVSYGETYKLGFWIEIKLQNGINNSNNVNHVDNVFVYRWDSEREYLVDIQDEDERFRYALGVINNDFFAGMGPYPMQTWRQWQSLIGYISPLVVDVLQPANKEIVSEAMKEQRKELKKQQQQQQQQQKSNNNVDEDSDEKAKVVDENVNFHHDTFLAHYTTIPKRYKPNRGEKLSADEVTRYNLDKSKILINLLNEEWFKMNYESLLGELQFAFVSFLVGHSMEGFEQYKEICLLLSCCDSAVEEYPQLFAAFADIFWAQLQSLPEDVLFEELAGKNNFIIYCIKAYHENTFTSSISSVQNSSQTFWKNCEQKFGDMLIDDDDEDKPAVVYL